MANSLRETSNKHRYEPDLNPQRQGLQCNTIVTTLLEGPSRPVEERSVGRGRNHSKGEETTA